MHLFPGYQVAVDLMVQQVGLWSNIIIAVEYPFTHPVKMFKLASDVWNWIVLGNNNVGPEVHRLDRN